jgi:hypothetical protein
VGVGVGLAVGVGLSAVVGVGRWRGGGGVIVFGELQLRCDNTAKATRHVMTSKAASIVLEAMPKRSVMNLRILLESSLNAFILLSQG